MERFWVHIPSIHKQCNQIFTDWPPVIHTQTIHRTERFLYPRSCPCTLSYFNLSLRVSLIFTWKCGLRAGENSLTTWVWPPRPTEWAEELILDKQMRWVVGEKCKKKMFEMWASWVRLCCVLAFVLSLHMRFVSTSLSLSCACGLFFLLLYT